MSCREFYRTWSGLLSRIFGPVFLFPIMLVCFEDLLGYQTMLHYLIVNRFIDPVWFVMIALLVNLWGGFEYNKYN